MHVLNVMPINYKGTSVNKDNNISPNYRKNVLDSVSFGLKLPDNFGTVIKKKLFRGGFLTEEHFKTLKKKGVTLILDLCGDEKGKSNLEEAKLAEKFGIKYVYQDGYKFFPYKKLNKGAIPKKELEKVSQLVKKELDKPNGVVYVHCRKGQDRTGLFVGYYELIILKKPVEKAREDHAKHNGFCDDFNDLLKTIANPAYTL